MMKNILVCLVAFELCLAVLAQNNACAGKPDKAIVEINCWRYGHCSNGSLVYTECKVGEVFERDSLSCKPLKDANTKCCPCFQNTTCKAPDCTGKLNGTHTDDPRCQTFFTCHNGNPVTNCRSYCSANLVFNSKEQSCDWAYNVPAPCGTATVTSPPPASKPPASTNARP